MSDDVLSKLKGLCEEVRARIEATADFKSLMAMERAMGEVQTILAPPPVAEAVAEDAPAVEVVEAVEAEAEAEAPQSEVAAVEAADAPAEAAEAAPEASAEPETVTDEAPVAAASEVSVVVPDIPAEDQALVAELAAVTSEPASNGAVTPST